MSATRTLCPAGGTDTASRRVNVDCAALLRRAADGNWLEARALELNCEGLRLRAARGIDTGTPVRIQLRTAGVPSPLELIGEVVRCVPSDAGTGFDLCCSLRQED